MLTLAQKRMKKARDFVQFQPLIKTPVAAVGLAMPANGRLGVSSPAGGPISVTVGGRAFTTPALAANQIFRLPFIEKDKSISALTAGAIVHVFDSWMVPYRITS